MDPDLERVIRQALGDALAAGWNHPSQTEHAVQAVLQVRPDMTASDALAAVNHVKARPGNKGVTNERDGHATQTTTTLTASASYKRKSISGGWMSACSQEEKFTHQRST